MTPPTPFNADQLRELIVYVNGNYCIALIELDQVQPTLDALFDAARDKINFHLIDCNDSRFHLHGAAIDGWYVRRLRQASDPQRELVDILKKQITDEKRGEEWREK